RSSIGVCDAGAGWRVGLRSAAVPGGAPATARPMVRVTAVATLTARTRRPRCGVPVTWGPVISVDAGAGVVAADGTAVSWSGAGGVVAGTPVAGLHQILQDVIAPAAHEVRVRADAVVLAGGHVRCDHQAGQVPLGVVRRVGDDPHRRVEMPPEPHLNLRDRRS